MNLEPSEISRDGSPAAGGPEPRPFAAPCRALPADAPLRWIRLGWNDLRRAPAQSLGYGLMMLALTYGIAAVTWWWGNIGLYLGMLSGFVFVGPCLAMGLYAISIQLERGQASGVAGSLLAARGQIGNAMVFALILTVVFLLWARAAMVLYVFFPGGSGRTPADLLLFLGIGSSVGAVFCSIVFAASAFSLPMLMDRKVDSISAVVSSVNAVLSNKKAMLVWASIIAGCVVLGLLTAFIAFLVLLPLLGYATWHAYRDAIDASTWPPLNEHRAAQQG